VTNTSICGVLKGANSVVVIGVNVGVKPVITAASNVALVPNPNKGDFTVKGTLGTVSDQEVSLEVTDMIGQVIYRAKVMTHNGEINERIQLDHNIANGMYILSLNSATEGHVFHVVVEQ
jgi:tetrahydrodipicolinate N-succinyltransferase